MPSISSLLIELQHDFPTITFTAGSKFYWSPKNHTVTYIDGSNETAHLLHELAHGLLGHATYSRDVELLAMERDAWQHAQHELSLRYRVIISQKKIEDALDSYRDWLHARSTCPKCQATGIQTARRGYKCLACQAKWQVNEARQCALRRYTSRL